jgi:sensor histidine kinase regulating citrate/malate metabolism
MPKDPTPPAESAAAQPAPVAPLIVMTAADVARQREVDALLRRQAKDDAARAASKPIEMVANVAFTLVTDEHPDGREVRPGERFEISAFDVPAFLGKARLADEELPPARGATIS